jgi:hemolysin III
VSSSLAVPEREQSRGEEIANSVSHGVGLVAALGATPFLIAHGVRRDDPGLIVGTSVFGATMVLLYLASTLYHALPRGKVKGVFQIIERAAIFLLIAGTYTPFTLGVLRGAWEWTLFSLVWVLAAVGVCLTVVDRVRYRALSMFLYLGMGWLIVVAIRQLWSTCRCRVCCGSWRVVSPTRWVWPSLQPSGCATPISFGTCLLWRALPVTSSQCCSTRPNHCYLFARCYLSLFFLSGWLFWL